MSSRKAAEIIETLRTEIVSGTRAPGSRLPTYDSLMERFSVARPTVARALDVLRNEGLIADRPGQQGLFVAGRLPHHSRYYWVTSEQPGSSGWTGFLSAMYDLIQRGETGIAEEIVPLIGVDGRANNPRYQRLCEVIGQGSAAGLFLMASAMVNVLPALETPGLPRVAIWTPLPHASVVTLDFDGLLDRAVARLFEKAGSVAILSPHRARLTATEQRLLSRLDRERVTPLHVTPVGCQEVTELLFDRSSRPEALFVTDDNLVEPVTAGLRRAGVRPGVDVYVLAHCNWPRPLGPSEGVDRIGFDVREIFALAKECIDEERRGSGSVKRQVSPRFIDELPDQYAVS